jgi:hypothetical protein
MDRLRYYLKHIDWKFVVAALVVAVLAYAAMRYRIR